MVVRRGRRALVDRSWLWLRLCVIASVVLSAASGCGDDTPAAGITGFAGSGGPAGAGGTTGGGGLGGMAGTDATAGVAGSAVAPIACPTPAEGAPAVTVRLIAADPPTLASGGPLVDGLYYMTESSVYSGPDGQADNNYASYSDTLVVAHAATGIARVTEIVEGNITRLQRFTMRSAGATLEVSDTCPEFEYPKYSYTYAAAGATLSILGATRLVVYTRQE